MALDNSYVEQWIRKRLGEPIIPVELDTTQIQSAIEESLRIFNRYKPQIKRDQFLLIPGQSVYPMDPAKVGYGVIKCAVPPSKYRFGLGWGFGDEFSVFDSTVVQDISYYHTAISYYKQSRKVLSANFEWKYLLDRREIEVTPTPQESLTLYYVYVGGSTIAEIQAHDEDWVLKYALLESKGMLGEIREALNAIQGNQTTVQLNGAQLKAEANEQAKQDAVKELINRVGDRFLLPLRDS